MQWLGRAATTLPNHSWAAQPLLWLGRQGLTLPWYTATAMAGWVVLGSQTMAG